jgi:hypothetical protein
MSLFLPLERICVSLALDVIHGHVVDQDCHRSEAAE